MDKKILTPVLLGFFTLPFTVFAQLHTYGPGVSIQTIVTNIEMAAGLVFGCIAVICFVVAGVSFLTAGGSAEKIKTARSAFFWGLGGVVVGIAAFSIIALVANFIV